eukprot:TRINITY_DN1148_c0_g1_i2.p1 TRINITY_DN1148_c0_g1~~TRINITY_DN1148_c0_g1_i2.p1  ORF type:complete len:385 (-),score=49.01 TRINITY_DN1148_c0_g1_i2:839-1993(-)
MSFLPREGRIQFCLVGISVSVGALGGCYWYLHSFLQRQITVVSTSIVEDPVFPQFVIQACPHYDAPHLKCKRNVSWDVNIDTYTVTAKQGAYRWRTPDPESPALVFDKLDELKRLQAIIGEDLVVQDDFYCRVKDDAAPETFLPKGWRLVPPANSGWTKATLLDDIDLPGNPQGVTIKFRSNLPARSKQWMVQGGLPVECLSMPLPALPDPQETMKMIDITVNPNGGFPTNCWVDNFAMRMLDINLPGSGSMPAVVQKSEQIVFSGIRATRNVMVDSTTYHTFASSLYVKPAADGLSWCTDKFCLHVCNTEVIWQIERLEEGYTFTGGQFISCCFSVLMMGMHVFQYFLTTTPSVEMHWSKQARKMLCIREERAPLNEAMVSLH